MKIIKVDKKEYLGKWVALKDLTGEEDVICFDTDMEKVKQMAKELGYEKPYLLFMPEKSVYVH